MIRIKREKKVMRNSLQKVHHLLIKRHDGMRFNWHGSRNRQDAHTQSREYLPVSTFNSFLHIFEIRGKKTVKKNEFSSHNKNPIQGHNVAHRKFSRCRRHNYSYWKMTMEKRCNEKKKPKKKLCIWINACKIECKFFH